MKIRRISFAARSVAVLSLSALLVGCGTHSTFASQPTRSRTAMVGSSLSFVDMAGSSHNLSDVEATGRKSVLVFWQTWCVPCRREGPVLAAAARAYSDSLAFFGVISGPDGTVDDSKVRSTAAAMGVEYPQVRDRDASLARRYAIQSTPTILVLGNGGEVLYRGHHAPKDWNQLW